METLIPLFIILCNGVGMNVVEFDFLQLPKILAAVGKFHLPAHIKMCRYLFSMHWLPGAGQTDGEAAERVWSAENTVALRSREMSSGHRHDFLNFFRGDKNVQRLHNMGT